MRTTLKRGVGRGAGANGNGRAIYPPGTVSTVTRYRQPPEPQRSALGLVRRIMLGTFVVVSSLGFAVGGGAYLWAHESVSALHPHTAATKRATKALDAPVANEPATALVIGYDHRAGEGASPSRSDTLMLIRADPATHTISLLSFPRDLEVPIYCGADASDTTGHVILSADRINSAYADCGPKGTLLTIKHLTGLPINYLITVNFHGFKEVVDKVGGVWMDVDRRYYNRNTGASYDNFANINLQPGYQLLSGQQALDFVRFRHTDSDLYRLARQQEFIKSFREQVAKKVGPTNLLGIVDTITHNVEVGEGGGHSLDLSTVKSYAQFAASLPPGHVFQDRFENVQCLNTCTASSDDIQAAVQQFVNPDVQTPKDANAAALGNKIKQKTLPPSKVTVTVLNGNGVSGAAANTSYLLAQHGYQMLVPPNQLKADAPARVFHTKIYYDPAQPGSLGAANALKQLVEPADVAKLPRQTGLLPLDPGSMLLVVVGETFSGSIPPAPPKVVPVHHPAVVRADSYYGAKLLDPLKAKAGFPLETPTVLERGSYPDTLPGDKPVRVYWIDGQGKHKAVRLVFRTGANAFWGIEETNWDAAPVLGDRSFRHDLGGREFDLYYSGSHLHMVVLHAHDATYWVVNSLRDDLSNETMLAIAKGLKPLTPVK